LFCEAGRWAARPPDDSRGKEDAKGGPKSPLFLFCEEAARADAHISDRHPEALGA
jgi:hypothetical protein